MAAVSYGVLLVGAPGAGKSTLCQALCDAFVQLKRNFKVVNIDPANERIGYSCDVDVRELIRIDEVMQRLKLGPNGALRYCMQTVRANVDWLVERLRPFAGENYFIIDAPGQLELYHNDGDVGSVVRELEKRLKVRLCAVHLSDALYCADAGKFISVAMAALSVMVNMEMPQINVLSKSDLVVSSDLPYESDVFRRLPDLSRIAELLQDVPGMESYAELSTAIGEVISDFDLVSFLNVSVLDKLSIATLIAQVDKANGFGFHDMEDLRAAIVQRT